MIQQTTFVAYFTKEVNPRLAKRPLKTNGRLNRGLTSLVKEATDDSSSRQMPWYRTRVEDPEASWRLLHSGDLGWWGRVREPVGHLPSQHQCEYGQHINWSVVRVTTLVFIGHYDVIKWRHFRRYWPFVRGIHRWLYSSCCLSFIFLSKITDEISLQWRHNYIASCYSSTTDDVTTVILETRHNSVCVLIILYLGGCMYQYMIYITIMSVSRILP